MTATTDVDRCRPSCSAPPAGPQVAEPERLAALLGALPRGQGGARRRGRDRAPDPDRDLRRPDRRRRSPATRTPTAYTDTMEDEFGIPKGPNTTSGSAPTATGRDLFVRTMYGARTSLLVGVVASGIAVLIGLVVGLIAGFFGGWSDTILSRSARRDARAAAAADLDRHRRGVQHHARRAASGGIDPARDTRSSSR